MSKEKRYLIATADERTWKFDRPVVFLGEWCRLYDRKHLWNSMDAVVAEPYGLGMVKKDADYAEARQLEDKIFPLLCNTLNNYHKTEYGERFWKILLGHWFRRYVDVLLNRFKTLQNCLNSYNISGVTVYENDQYSLAPLNSYDAIWAFNDDRWNDALISHALTFQRHVDLPVEFIKGYAPQIFIFDSKLPTFNFFFEWGYRQASKLLSTFQKNTDAMIINSYLPAKESIKLQLALKQVPQFYRSAKFEVSKRPDFQLRQGLTANGNSSKRTLESFLANMLFQLLPLCYLEGFEDLNRKAKEQPWPKRPKFIFSSNNFDTDEVFKFWAASKTDAGYTYIVGQHGNNYGTYRYMNPSIEEKTSEKFLTWGWTDGQSKYIPALILKKPRISEPRYNPKGGLLLIEATLSHRITVWDNHAEFSDYFKQQQDFICNLDDKLRSELTIRLHSEYKFHNWAEVDRWSAFNPDLKIETGDFYIGDLIAQNRLAIHSYDSTGILETLSQNIPTIAFWQNGLDHLRDSVKPHYQILVDVGIIHLDPLSAAQKVNEVWNNIDEWWLSAKVQKARKFFCKNYARASNKPISDLKAIFEDAINLQKG